MSNTDALSPVEFSRRLRALGDSALSGLLDHSLPAWTETHGLPVNDVTDQPS